MQTKRLLRISVKNHIFMEAMFLHLFEVQIL